MATETTNKPRKASAKKTTAKKAAPRKVAAKATTVKKTVRKTAPKRTASPVESVRETMTSIAHDAEQSVEQFGKVANDQFAELRELADEDRQILAVPAAPARRLTEKHARAFRG